MGRRGYSTIMEVAREAGVSPATVSRVFNRHRYVRSEVKERVVEAARRLNYAPKSSRSQNSVGIMVHGDKQIALGAYETQMITAISHEFFQHGITTEIISDQQIFLLHKNSFLTLITLSLLPSEELLKLGIPLLIVNDVMPGVSSVVTDHYQGIELGMKHLLELGHRDIAFISGVSHNWGYYERLRAYKDGLAAAGVEYREQFHIDAEKDNIITAVIKLMKRKPTAIIASGEGRAQHICHAFYLMDKKIPDDMSVITFEDVEVSQYLLPPQTTISQDIGNVAKNVVELALEMINAKDGEQVLRNIVLENKLIVRDSTRRI